MLTFDHKVSIIIPTYNGADYIECAIKSIQEQTYNNFELLVIDDGSTDSTPEIVKSFNDNRIKYIYKDNAGPASAYNYGFKAATGDFIFIMDHDDYSYPNRITKQLEYMISEELEICGCFFEIKREERDFVEKKMLPIKNAEISRELLFRPWVLFNPTLCIKKTVFLNHGFFDENLFAGYDYDFLLRVSDNVKCGNVPEILYQWTLHKSSHGWLQVEKGNNLFQTLSIKKINSHQLGLTIGEKYFYEGMVYYYTNSFLKAAIRFFKSIISGISNNKVTWYLFLSTFLAPAVYVFRRQQLFSHPVIVRLKRIVHGTN